MRYAPPHSVLGRAEPVKGVQRLRVVRAALLICAIALDHLLRRLLTGALMLGRGEASSMLPLTRPPTES